jgi:hypothetical protein
MTARPLDLTQRQIRALCKGAKKDGYVPVIEIGNAVVKLVPEDRALAAIRSGNVDEPPAAAYDRWKAKDEVDTWADGGADAEGLSSFQHRPGDVVAEGFLWSKEEWIEHVRSEGRVVAAPAARRGRGFSAGCKHRHDDDGPLGRAPISRDQRTGSRQSFDDL